MPIRILSEEIASQIAAGEVVERPASVVKELLENALDAHAAHIAVTVESAGKRLIEVADDGAGIPPAELSLAVARHATSKLAKAEDLFRISTLGFRGEALASMASVSRLTLTSRPKDSDMGARLVVEGGVAGEVQPVGAPAGTVVRVEDLFYNVPARLKFLKSDATERRQIDALVSRYALAYPDVRIVLKQEGRTSLQTSGQGDRREALAVLYGADIAKQMLEVNAEYEGWSVRGFVSPTSITRSNRGDITFFVNGRWVHDLGLTTALVQAYHTLLMVGRYPMAVLFLDLPPDKVDVNVHPAKAEVRFAEKDEIFSGVQRGVRRALLAYSPVPAVNADVRWTPAPMREFGAMPTESGMPDFSNEAQETETESTALEQKPVQPRLPQDGVPLLRLVGQVGTAYLVAEGPDGLYLIDQHAAHERVLFERFMAQRGQKIESQTLLEPALVELPAQSARLIEGQLPLMQTLGFEIEPFGPNAYRVRSMPAMLIGSEPAAALRTLIEDFEEDETPLQHEAEAKIIARVCKRAAVKAGQTLSPEEQRALLADLEACASPRTCPHGRPTMIHLSIDLLERQFGRKGAR